MIGAGANPVTEHEFKLFQRAMSEQGLSHSSTAEIIAKASSKKNSTMDAWGYDYNRNLTLSCGLLPPPSNMPLFVCPGVGRDAKGLTPLKIFDLS